ncbi:signal transduction histidine kinase [Streptosporangium album]|uniref:histidine kinase n=1 Tax=Streptosporangium album TaxID=47479 RepID=A0A7W7S210_9ACTN|nr:histidine kinase [Streptosporangium album]MBB4942468.1 signal transduction histidine kinase [Streptosporangium album]
MGRHLLAAVVVGVDTALLLAGTRNGLPGWIASAVVLVVVLRYRSAAGAFTAALVLSALTGGAYVLLLWSAYQAGREVVSRWDTTVVAGSAVGVALGSVAVRLWGPSGDPRVIASVLSTYGVFVALPLLAGRYLAQHERLVSALGQRNRQLGLERELLAEQERLRIARDMHDSLGHRLSLVSIQAAALEVSALPAEQRQAVQRLAGAARGAMDELHELVGALRGTEEPADRSVAVKAVGTLVEGFRGAGAAVTLRQRGEPRPLPPAAEQAAYRVVEEGLTNAAKHAPGQPVTVSVDWESDALLLTVANPLPDGPVSAGAGHGLSGLSERVGPAGGVLDHRLSGDGFRLFAMLPVVAGEPGGDDDLPAVGRVRMVAVGAAVAALTFVLLPASMLVGVRA